MNGELSTHVTSRNRFLACFLAAMLSLLASPLLEAQNPQTDVHISDFDVMSMQGHVKRFSPSHGKATVVMFFSTRCPMSNAFNSRRNDLYHAFRKQARFIIIDSQANESLEEERTYAKEVGFAFPVFHDAENRVADLFGARVTTDTFLLDETGAVRYHGYIEDAPNPERTTRQGLRLALTSVLAGQPVGVARTRAVGCAIRRAHP